MHDGVPCHRSKKVKDFLSDSNIPVLDWPGKSPDLNPIENTRAIVKDKVAMKNSGSLEELKRAIKTVWTMKITQEYCKKLIESMPERITAVIAAEGGHSKY